MPKILKDFSGKEKYDDLYKWSMEKYRYLSALGALGIVIIIAFVVFSYVYAICSSDIPTWAKWLILTR